MDCDNEESMLEKKFKLPFQVFMTRDVKGNVIDVNYTNVMSKTKLSIDTTHEFSLIADVDLLIDDDRMEKQQIASSSNVAQFQDSQELAEELSRS